MATVAELLVGRVAELGALDTALAGLERREAAVLELAGEPGIGKTRLVAELGRRAEARGWLVLAGSASELERELPFGLFVDALDEYVQSLEPRRLRALEDSLPALAHVLPSLRAEAAPQLERYRMHRAVRLLLEALAEPKPLVLLLDDVHWADSGSTELLGALLRRPPAAPVLIALAARPRQLPERLSSALQRAGTLSRIELGPLSQDEARELVGDAAAAATYEESGGNPFYLEQLARAPSPADGHATAGGVSLGGLRVPRGVATALIEELAALPTRRVARSRAPRWQAIRSSPRWPRLPRICPMRRPWRPWTSSCGVISCAPPTCPAGSASGTRSCGAPSMRRRQAAGCWGRTSARRARWRRAATRRRLEPITWSARLATAIWPPSPCCGRRARRRRRAPLRRRPDCSRRRSGCRRPAGPRRCGSSS